LHTSAAFLEGLVGCNWARRTQKNAEIKLGHNFHGHEKETLEDRALVQLPLPRTRVTALFNDGFL
jgi:hypothetical protein